jgi:tetratricopeptide (TPR) repeat protein
MERKKQLIIIGALIIILALAVSGFFYLRISKWHKAESLYLAGNLPELAKIIKPGDMPSNLTDLNIYARTMNSVGNFDESYKALEKMYSLDKSNDTKLLMANILVQKKDFSGAEKLYIEITQQNPNFVQAYLNLASLYRTEGKNQTAIDMLASAIKNNPNSVQLYEYLVTIGNPTSSPDYNSWKEKLKVIDPNNTALK